MHSKNKNITQLGQSRKPNILHKQWKIVEVEGLDDPMFRADDIQDVFNTFDDCILMGHHEKVMIYLRMSSSFLSSASRTIIDSSLPLSKLPDVLEKHQTFIIFRDSKSASLILPTNEPFTYVPEITVTSGKVSLKQLRKNKSKQINSLCKRSDKIVYLNKLKHAIGKAIPVTPTEDVHKVFPFYGNELHYPVQVSEDQQNSPFNTLELATGAYRTTETYQPRSRDHMFEIQNSIYDFVPRQDTSTRHPDNAKYDRRLKSYVQVWRHDKPTPQQLAEAGFFYTNQADLVRCFQCGIGLKDFSSDDDPLFEHVRHSENCLYLLKYPDQGRLSDIKLQLRASDPEYLRQNQLNGLRHDSLAVQTTRYRHPEYETLEARLRTFVGWPPISGQTPRQLAEAGLYYTGVEDHVRCFACDGGLRRWDPEDDPWTEHCRWFPACPYCIQQKGLEFIALVQAAADQEFGAAGGDAVVAEFQRLNINGMEIQTVYNENRIHYLNMGFKENDVKDAILELHNRGLQTPSLGEIVDQIDVVIQRKSEEEARQRKQAQSDSPYEQNVMLKRMVYCSKCHRNIVNALFLPCSHLKLCMECATPLVECPFCHKTIMEKIKTFMG